MLCFHLSLLGRLHDVMRLCSDSFVAFTQCAHGIETLGELATSLNDPQVTQLVVPILLHQYHTITALPARGQYDLDALIVNKLTDIALLGLVRLLRCCGALLLLFL